MIEQRIRKVAVIGAGTLGSQIAALAACFNYEVSAYDSDESSFRRGIENLKDSVQKAPKTPILPLQEWEKGIHKIKFCPRFEETLQEVDLVVEAVPESLELKRKTFEKLDALAPPDAILATNSSSIPISKIESATKRLEQCLNIHFYNPAMGLNMADIMGGTRTSSETIAAGKMWLRSLGCVPLTVKKEILGFCFNRIWRVIKKEALHMWAEGYVDFQDIDRAWMIFTGTSQGPFGLMDGVGLDVVYDIEMVYYNESQDPRDYPPTALKALLDKKELGVKTQKGFYTYPDPEYSRPDFLEKQEETVRSHQRGAKWKKGS
jgi:3-hydroxybutyryl-CoA dehydrogenase